MSAALVERAVQLARHFLVQPARDKRPTAEKGWPQLATNDVEKIRDMFFAAPGADQISILTGRGIVVLDVDVAKGGNESITALATKHGQFPATVCTSTGGGGWHLFFRLPAGVEVRNKQNGELGAGLDIRGDGGQVIGPGSAHPSGRTYEWASGCSPDEIDFAPCPEWLLALIRKEPPRVVAPPPIRSGANRHEALYRASRYLEKLEPAVSGQGGHQKAWEAALAVAVGFDLSEGDAYELLATEYNPRCSPPWSEKELRHKLAGAAKSSLPRGYLLNAPRPGGATVHQLPRPLGSSTPPPPASSSPEQPAEGTVLGEQLANGWRTIEEHGPWLEEMPPRRRWLLRVPSDATSGRDERGLLPFGKVGMLVAGGGVGKTMALTQLALAVATGRPWLAGKYSEGGFLPPEGGGRVLMLMAEEEAEEMHRRFYSAHEVMKGTAGLTDEERVIAKRRITVLPLAGESVSLVTGSGGKFGREDIRPSPLAAELLERLNAPGDPWSLIILDPLSRFAGLDTETDNAAATRFIQVLETLTHANGEPTILVAHHASKLGRGGDAPVDAGAARGASALTDGVRWVAELKSEPMPEDAAPGTPRTATFRVTKSNYSALLDEPVRLVRGDHGELTAVSPREERERAAAKAQRDAQRAEQAGKKRSRTKFEQVIVALKQHPQGIGRNAIAAIASMSENTVKGILEALILEGKVTPPETQKGGYKWVG